MNLKISVFGQQELEQKIDEAHTSHLISIGNPPTLFNINGRDCTIPAHFKTKFKSILRLSFFDVERKNQLSWRQFPRRVAKKSDIKRIIKYFNKTRQEATGYTIHCWAGVSRSTAVAFGLLYLITGSEIEASEQLKKIRPQALPNASIVALFDQVLDSHLAARIPSFRSNWIERTKQELNIVGAGLLEELDEVTNE